TAAPARPRPAAPDSGKPSSAPDAGPPLSQEATAPPHEDRPVSERTTSKDDPAWSTCHRKVQPKGIDPVKDIAALTSACQAITKMNAVGKIVVGKQTDAEPPQSYPLVAEAGRCYRVYAQADRGIL